MKERIKKGYAACWEYLKESKIYFLVVFSIFLVATVFGFFFPVFFIEFIKNFIQQLAEKTTNMNFFQLLIFIFQNNLITAFMGLVIGIIFGLFPVFLVVFNGYVLGFVAGKTFKLLGFTSLWRLLPHGIFELSALIISLGLGLKLARFIFVKSGKRKKQLAYDLENSLRVFVYIVLPLLIIAAIIETILIFFV